MLPLLIGQKKSCVACRKGKGKEMLHPYRRCNLLFMQSVNITWQWCQIVLGGLDYP